MTRPTLTPQTSERLKALFDRHGRDPDGAFGTEGSAACFAAGKRLFVEGCYTSEEFRFLAELLDTVHGTDGSTPVPHAPHVDALPEAG
jgi:hypothetical protein